MKTDYSYRAYDVFRLDDGVWVWCGYGNGRAILPEYVCKRLAEGRPVECVVNGYRYCIKPPTRGQSRSQTHERRSKPKRRVGVYTTRLLALRKPLPVLLAY